MFEVNVSYLKAYYYIICLITLIVLMWGLIDTASAIGNVLIGPSLFPGIGAQPGLETGEMPGRDSGMPFENYYNKRLTFDRLLDSISRIFVSGLIYIYARFRVSKLENGGKA